MADLADGETVEMQGSGSRPYVLKNVGGVYSCTCPAWRNQSLSIERRTCKHLKRLRGEAAEAERIGSAVKPAATGTQAAAQKPEAPPVMLAETWDNVSDLQGWWMSEKLDGVRAYWDGTKFLSRNGNQYHAPDWFVDGLPEVPLDGELWMDRQKFQKTVSVVRRQDKSQHWKQIRFVVFDAPGVDDVVETRVQFYEEFFAKHALPYAAAHQLQACQGIEHLRQELTRIESLGGEGLMLRQPGSRYAAGRSSTLLKVKSFRDAEATVVAHIPGKGRHKGRLGAVEVQTATGIRFSVGTGFSDKQRENPPPVGAVITYRYQELSDMGVPRFPSFIRVVPNSP